MDHGAPDHAAISDLQSMANASPAEEAVPVPLPPHRYPFWLLAFAALILGGLVYSGWSLPRYVAATRHLKAARLALADGDNAACLQQLDEVLARVPKSAPARKDKGLLLLFDGDDRNDAQALLLLDGVYFSEDERAAIWEELPQELRKKFREVR